MTDKHAYENRIEHDSKQRAKFYTITLLGKQQMISDHERWQVLVKAVGAIMSPKQEPL
jgi:PadR family transcriptional regulator PadR